MEDNIKKLYKGYSNLIKSNLNLVPEYESKIADERMKICKDCDKYNTLLLICNQCTCYLPAKTKCIECKCPQNKW